MLALVAVGMTLLLAAPAVRAGVSGWFAWYSVQVRVPPTPAAGSGAGEQQDSSVAFERETLSEDVLRVFTEDLAAAREFLGNGVALPPALEGRSMLLYRDTAEDGTVVVIGISEPELGFWARFRPAGDHQIRVTYGSDFQISTQVQVIDGRRALLVIASRASGKPGPAEIWIEDGNWVYELRDDYGNMDRLIKLVESMR
jgi:hypothetical protein